MPVDKNKRTTSDADLSRSKSETPSLPDQHTFHEHLRALTRNAVRVVIEEVMREELEYFLGAAWGENTPERKGYRNGTYTRDLATSSGPIEDLRVPMLLSNMKPNFAHWISLDSVMWKWMQFSPSF